MLREIAGEQYFYPKVKEVVSKSLELKRESRTILIIGRPGSGKSVFISQLYDELKDKVEYLTAIRTEFLNQADSPRNVFELFERVKNEDRPKFLLLDSLDVLAYTRRRELHEWLSYVEKLKDIKRTTVICASRNFEAQHLYPMNQQAWSEKIPIELLPDEFINKVFNKLNYDYNSISPKFREFLRIPLHLRIAADIIQRGGKPKDICTLQGIYAKLLELLNISPNDMSALTKLAEWMIANRRIHLPYPLIAPQLIEYIGKKKGPGIAAIIQIDQTNQRLSFSHETLIDYFSAWKVINENKSIVDFALEHNQSLFIRPVLRHILGFLRSSEKRLFEELSKLFFEEDLDKKIGFKQKDETIRMHIKTAILADVASWDNPTTEEAEFLLRLFRETKNRQAFMIQFFNSGPNSDWYAVLKDIYILPILNARDDSDIQYRTILSFLSRIAKDRPCQVLDISSLLLTRKYNRTVEWFFCRVSDELSRIELDSSLKKRYADFLEQMVRRNFVKWYYEIQTACSRIGKYFPEKGLKLYFDSIMAELQDKESEISLSRGSLTGSFNRVLPLIYEKLPYQVLLMATDFFEQIISSNYSGEKRLPDWPDRRLYSEWTQRSGLDAFYEWYKSEVLEFCSSLTQEAKQIIEKLQESSGESQRQLSMLCKIKNAFYFRDDILSYVKGILRSDLKDAAVREQRELFIRALEKVFEVISSRERDEVVSRLLDLELEDASQVRVWIWKPLHHIPESFHDERIRKKLEEIRDKYKFDKEYRYTPPLSSPSVQWALPPVPADVLRAKAPNELCQFLIENRELKERWDFEKNKFHGGVSELAREVATVLAEDLGKYKNVIENLSKDSANDKYLAWLFWAISQRGAAKEDLDWIIELISLVYKRETLQLEIVTFLGKIVDKLSENQFDKLKNILFHLSEAKDPEEDKFFEYRKQGCSNDALTEGINSTRGALAETVILLLSRFKRLNESYMFDILEKLSNDKTVSVRAALLGCLPRAIESLGWDKCFKLFSNAFEKGAEEYSENIPEFLQYAPKSKVDKLREILDKIKEKREGRLGEAYALIMTVYYLKGICSEKALMELLQDKKLVNKGKQESFNLLANQARFEANVDKCLKIMSNLLEQQDVLEGKVSILFMQARPEDLKKFVPIIKKVVKKPKIRGEALFYILEYLERSILVDPLAVFNLLESILSQAGVDFYTFEDSIPASHSRAPLNIINTILECYPEEENRALKALDKLIELNWEGVGEYLNALDRL